MTVLQDSPMTHDLSARALAGLIGWALVILLAVAMIIGGFEGYNAGVSEHGGTPIPSWVGPLVATAFALLAGLVYVRRYRPMFKGWSQRRRRYWLSLALCAMVGGIVGAWFSVERPYDQGLLEAAASMPFGTEFAIGASGLWLVGLSVGSIFYHRSIDDHEQRAWLWAGLAGWYVVVLVAPVWWVLHRAALAPPADAMLLFLASLIVNGVVHLWLKFR